MGITSGCPMRTGDLLGSGTILREVEAGAELLQKDFGIGSDVWSVTSFNELAREGHDVDRWNMLHAAKDARTSHVERCLAKQPGPIIMATDYMQQYADQIRPYINKTFATLGTDGFGRSDSREALRHHFEVDRHWVVVAALRGLAEDGEVDQKLVLQAIKKYGIDPEKPNPRFE